MVREIPVSQKSIQNHASYRDKGWHVLKDTFCYFEKSAYAKISVCIDY